LNSYYLINSGRKELRISTAIPPISTKIVFLEHPFHSFKIIPHTFENVTLSAIRMQNARVSIELPASKKLRPSDKPKNWLYQRSPAKQQKRRLFAHTPPFL
jgi:hypothetical protein